VVKLAVAIHDQRSWTIRPAPGSIPGRCILFTILSGHPPFCFMLAGNHSRLRHGIHYCFEPDDRSWIRSQLRFWSFCNNLNSMHVLPVVSGPMLYHHPRRPIAVTGPRTGCSSTCGSMEHDSLFILCSGLRAKSLPTARRIGQYSMPSSLPWCKLERVLT
jgi:hypothetical protein